MSALQLFLPCAAGVEDLLAQEVHGLTGLEGPALRVARAGVLVQTDWAGVMRLNLHTRLAQRVLVQLAHGPCRHEQDLYEMARAVAWGDWFGVRQSFRVDATAQHSPLKSLNFAALRVKDAVADRFRDDAGARPDVNTRAPDVRLHLHLTADAATLYLDTSGEPLFKRGWREDRGDAPLKETLAAAMLAASGWWDPLGEAPPALPLYDPCCGSGTIVIEAAQIACGIAPGLLRRFGFERLRPHDAAAWAAQREAAQARRHAPSAPVYGSDVAHRMVDFAQRNARRAGVDTTVQLRGGDALQRMPPCEAPGVIVMNPPYGERIAVAGVAGERIALVGVAGERTARAGSARGERPAAGGVARDARAMREQAQGDDGGDFFAQLAAHWKRHYAGWTAWVLTPDTSLPARMRLKPSRRVPLWNGPIECRLLRFDMVAGRARP